MRVAPWRPALESILPNSLLQSPFGLSLLSSPPDLSVSSVCWKSHSASESLLLSPKSCKNIVCVCLFVCLSWLKHSLETILTGHGFVDKIMKYFENQY